MDECTPNCTYQRNLFVFYLIPFTTGTLLPYQPLRLWKVANRWSFYNRSPRQLGRSRWHPEPQARNVPDAVKRLSKPQPSAMSHSEKSPAPSQTVREVQSPEQYDPTAKQKAAAKKKKQKQKSKVAKQAAEQQHDAGGTDMEAHAEVIIAILLNNCYMTTGAPSCSLLPHWVATWRSMHRLDCM